MFRRRRRVVHSVTITPDNVTNRQLALAMLLFAFLAAAFGLIAFGLATSDPPEWTHAILFGFGSAIGCVLLIVFPVQTWRARRGLTSPPPPAPDWAVRLMLHVSAWGRQRGYPGAAEAEADMQRELRERAEARERARERAREDPPEPAERSA